MTFLEIKLSTATKCLDHLTFNHIIYNKLIHCNSPLLRYSCWCINGNSRPNNSRNNKKSPESVRNCGSYLCESKPVKFTVFSPKSEKRAAVIKLDGLVDLVKKEGINTPKTIVFCNAMNEIAVVLNYLMSQLGKKIFFPNYSPVKDNCLIGIYHSNSWQSSKDRVMEQFKSCGVKCVIIATTALCMGVNFPDVRFIINWGPARLILDQHQEAGRAGRDGKRVHVVVIYHGQQVGHCEQQMKGFVHTKGCFRVAAYKSLDDTMQPLEPPHDCCSCCSSICKCQYRSS